MSEIKHNLQSKLRYSRRGPFSRSTKFCTFVSVSPSRDDIYQTHLLDVRQARRADDDRVAVLALHEAVVRHPAERDLGHRQLVLLRDDLDARERLEVRVVPVPVAVVLVRVSALSQLKGRRLRGRTRPWPLLGSKREPGSTWSSIERYLPVKNPPPTVVCQR